MITNHVSNQYWLAVISLVLPYHADLKEGLVIPAISRNTNTLMRCKNVLNFPRSNCQIT